MIHLLQYKYVWAGDNRELFGIIKQSNIRTIYRFGYGAQFIPIDYDRNDNVGGCIDNKARKYGYRERWKYVHHLFRDRVNSS